MGISKLCPECGATYPINTIECIECGYDESCPCCQLNGSKEEKPRRKGVLECATSMLRRSLRLS